jgi:hypothetical protein
VESESLPSLATAATYELRSRAPGIELPFEYLGEAELERIKNQLAKHLRGSGVMIIHDLAVPAAATTIDHLCIGVNGITAIDVERAPKGLDREALIDRVKRETEILAAILTEAGVGSEQIGGAVCRPGRGLSLRASTAGGIIFGDPRRVAKAARRAHNGEPVDVQLALAVVRNRLGHLGQRSHRVTRPDAF